MALSTAKILGYGGSAEVIAPSGGPVGVQVLITSGSYSSSLAQSWLQMVATPPVNTQAANKVLHGDGVNAYTGSLSFDVTKAAMDLFSVTKLLQRWYNFDVGIHDGNVSYVMTNCKINSLSITGAAGGLVSASISFVAIDAFAAGTVDNAFIRDDVDDGYLIGYWWSGARAGLKAKSWTLTMTQDVQPVYGNLNSAEPLYLKAGLVEYGLEVESYTELVADSDVVYISTETFTLKGTTSEKSFQYNGVTDLGTYRYVFGTGAVTTYASDDPVIT